MEKMKKSVIRLQLAMFAALIYSIFLPFKLEIVLLWMRLFIYGIGIRARVEDAPSVVLFVLLPVCLAGIGEKEVLKMSLKN